LHDRELIKWLCLSSEGNVGSVMRCHTVNRDWR